jgi:hypothetical protein
MHLESDEVTNILKTSGFAGASGTKASEGFPVEIFEVYFATKS